MGLASLWIYYYHVFPISLIAQFHTPTQAEIYFRNLGFCGVDIFLVLSGVGLYYMLMNRPIKNARDYLQYFLRRCQRIYVVLVPSTLFIALVDKWTVREFLGKLLGIYQLGINVYAYLWYIPCILIFYIVFPVLFTQFQHYSKKRIGISIFILVWICLSYLLFGHVREDLYAIINRVPVFVCGMYFGHLSFHNERISGKVIIFALLSLAVGICVSYQHTQHVIPEVYPCFGAALNLLIAPQLVVIVAYAIERISKMKWNGTFRTFGGWIYKVFSTLGTISLEFYVVQEWICLKCRNSTTLLAMAGYSEWGQQILCLVLTIIASSSLHWLAEKCKTVKVTVSEC